MQKPPAPMVLEEWRSELTERISREFRLPGEAFAAYLGQPFVTIELALIAPLLEYLKLQEEFDCLIDLTAVDYPGRERRFELIYILYSFPANQRLRVKCHLAERDRPASISSIYPGANWLEREVYDMFGIEFAGHPHLTRILLPEDWTGHPLKKDYSIIQMDNRWVREHLGIDTGQ